MYRCSLSKTSYKVVGNKMTGSGLTISVSSLAYNSLVIDATNTINGKPIRYVANQTGGTLPSGAGQIILENCSHVTVEHQNLSGSSVGLELAFSNNCTLINNDCYGNHYGISVHFSTGSTITNNKCSANSLGIYLYSSKENTLLGNNCSGNSYKGIELYSSSKSTVTSNNCSSNLMLGIELYSSNSNTITDNTCSWNSKYGIYVEIDCMKNHIYNNVVISNNGATLAYNSSHIQAYDGNKTNYWNDTNGKGNYWSDWTGPDNNKDGVVDSPYIINATFSAKDFFPLTKPVIIVPEPSPLPLILLSVVLLTALVTRRRWW